MSQIRNYSIVVEHDPQDLVNSVTKAIGKGFVPCGGVSITREPAEPKKGVVTGRTAYAQAMVLLYRPEDALGQVVASVGAARVNGHSG